MCSAPSYPSPQPAPAAAPAGASAADIAAQNASTAANRRAAIQAAGLNSTILTDNPAGSTGASLGGSRGATVLGGTSSL